MCGIAGVIRVDGAAIPEEMLQILGEEIRHRGPDGQGVIRCPSAASSVALVHRRLAILDTTPAANQPMGSEDGRLWLTYNGEIYNYRELFQQLEARGYRFRSTGDTQVLLHAYEEWGSACLAKLNGMFAFAVWDGRRQELFAATDRLGIKPLFYFWDGSTLAFSSELRGLTAVLSQQLSEDPTALAFFSTLGYIPAPFSIYREIRKLEPGHWMLLRGTTLTMGRYWDVDFSRKERRSLSTLIPDIAQQLNAAVERQLVSDVPIGAFLSGGIDSGGVVASMARSSGTSVNTFTIGFPQREYDETPHARLMAARYRTVHREFQVTEQDTDVLPAIVRHFGEPFADSSALATYHLAAMTRRHVTVALSGDGGDELFCGYTINLGHQVSELYRVLPTIVRRRILRAVGNLRWSQTSRLNRVLLSLRKRLEDAELDSIHRVYSKNLAFPAAFREMLGSPVDVGPVEQLFDELLTHGDAASFLDRIAYLQVKLSLPGDMLTKVDRMSMAHSLEVRVPFLDHHFVEYMATVPADQRFRRWKTKWLLRKALEPYLPRELLWGKKRGFNVPVARWSAGNGATPSTSPSAHRMDIRDGGSWWGRMIYQEWYRQDVGVRQGRSLRQGASSII